MAQRQGSLLGAILVLLAFVELAQPWSVEYRVTGGIDGRNQRLILNDAGHATVESRREGRAEFELTAAELATITKALGQATAVVVRRDKPPAAYPDALYTSLVLTSGGATTKVDTGTGGVESAIRAVLSRGLRLAESQKPNPRP